MGLRTGKWPARLLAALGAVMAFLAVLVAVAAIVPWLLTLYYGWGHPEDGSAGDSAGWAILLLSPFLIPLVLVAGGIAAVVVYRATARRLTAD